MLPLPLAQQSCTIIALPCPPPRWPHGPRGTGFVPPLPWPTSPRVRANCLLGHGGTSPALPSHPPFATMPSPATHTAPLLPPFHTSCLVQRRHGLLGVPAVVRRSFLPRLLRPATFYACRHLCLPIRLHTPALSSPCVSFASDHPAPRLHPIPPSLDSLPLPHLPSLAALALTCNFNKPARTRTHPSSQPAPPGPSRPSRPLTSSHVPFHLIVRPLSFRRPIFLTPQDCAVPPSSTL